MLLIIIISVLLFGSVEDWAVAISGCLIVLIFNIFVVRAPDEFRDTLHGSKTVLYIIGAFTALFVLQIIPLPPAILKLLSPGKAELISFFSLDGFHAVSSNPYATLHAVIKFILYCMVFLLAIFLSRDERNVMRVMRTLVVFGFLLSIFTLIQKAAGNGKIYWFRELTKGGSLFGPFVNKNHFAGLIGMIIPLSIGVSLHEKMREKKILYSFFAAVMSFALFYSLSRGGIISLFVSMMVITYFVLRSKGSSRQIMVVVMVVFILVSYLAYFGFDRIIDRFTSDDLSLNQRILVWKSIFMSTWRKYWPVGSGLGTFPSLSPMYHPESIVSYFDHAHNDYLEYMVETGLVGFILLSVAVILFIRRIAQSLFFGDKRQSIIWASVASLTSMAVHSAVDFNLHITSNALMTVFLTGLLYGLADPRMLMKGRGE